MVQRVEPATFKNIEEGEVKYATKRVDVPADGTEQFVVKSPSANDVRANIISLSLRTGAAFTVDYKKDFSIDTAGTDMKIANARTDENDTTNMTFEYGGSYSGGNVVAESLIPGSTENKGAGTSVENIEIIVSNDDELMLEVTNQNSSSSAFFVPVFVFVEEPVE